LPLSRRIKLPQRARHRESRKALNFTDVDHPKSPPDNFGEIPAENATVARSPGPCQNNNPAHTRLFSPILPVAPKLSDWMVEQKGFEPSTLIRI